MPCGPNNLYQDRNVYCKRYNTTHLALLVPSQTNRIEVLDYLLWGVVLLDLSIEVETDHVARVDLAREFEELKEALSFSLLQVLLPHGNDKVYVHIVMVLFVILGIIKQSVTEYRPKYRTSSYLHWAVTLLTHHGLKLLLVVLGPLVNRKFGNLDSSSVDLVHDTRDVILVLAHLLDSALEATPPWKHRHLLFACHQAADVRDDIRRIVTRNSRAPTCSYLRTGCLRIANT